MTIRLSAADVESTAAEWLARQDSRNLTLEQQAEFDAWLAADFRHLGAFVRLEATWSRLDRASVLRGRQKGIERGISRRRLWRRVALAVGILLLLSLWTFGPRSWMTVDQQLLATAIGEMQRVKKADGSAIEINTASHVEVIFSRSKRHVQLLDGEANFEVAKDEKRPFVVEAGEATVTAVGTRFDVRMRSAEDVVVIVIEGIVDVRTLGSSPAPIRVSAGNEIVLGRAGALIRAVTLEEMTRRIAWRNGELIFAGETLAEAMAEFTRYDPRRVFIADPKARELLVGGVVRANDVRGFAQLAARTFGLSVSEEHDGSLVLTRMPSSLVK